MKERPILMSAPMVRAVLDGRKSQTRRVVKRGAVEWLQWFSDEDNSDRPVIQFSETGHSGPGWYVWSANYSDEGSACVTCPFGGPGDRLWVRETWGSADKFWTGEHDDPPYSVGYRADLAARHIAAERPGPRCETTGWNWDVMKWRPSIHMPRWASRITLEVTDVRVERLQDISREDAIAEGVEAYDDDGVTYYGPLNHGHADPKVAFRGVWDSIYGEDSWTANVWVWAISFKRVTP